VTGLRKLHILSGIFEIFLIKKREFNYVQSPAYLNPYEIHIWRHISMVISVWELTALYPVEHDESHQTG